MPELYNKLVWTWLKCDKAHNLLWAWIELEPIWHYYDAQITIRDFQRIEGQNSQRFSRTTSFQDMTKTVSYLGATP